MPQRLCIFFIFSYYSISIAASPVLIKYAQTDSRAVYPIELLKLALSKTDKAASHYTLKAMNSDVSQGRLERQLLANTIDLAILPTNTYRESSFIPVKVPLYQGLAGYRVLLTNKENLERFNTIKNLGEFSSTMTAGFGAHWADLPILTSNNIKVVPGTSYERLFSMLKHQRFDYIPRSVPEVLAEYKHFSIENPKLVIEKTIGLFYPLQIYFFVHKNKVGLAKELKKGLDKALKDGSFKALFLKHHKSSIDSLNLEQRRLFILKKPDNYPIMANVKKSWWLAQ